MLPNTLDTVVVASNLGASSTSAAVAVKGGAYMLSLKGTLGTGDKIQVQDNGGNWATIAYLNAGTMTALALVTALCVRVDLPQASIRYVSGSGGSGIYAYLSKIPL